MFESTKEDLKKLLEYVDKGELQLPDFQRDWVWTDEDIRGLLASVSRGFPVGAILTLRTGGPHVDFKPRPIAGVDDKGVKPAELLLDGQQRITSLYQALFSKKAIHTTDAKGNGVKRFYYVNIKAACAEEADFDDLIVSVPETRIRMKPFGREAELDLSTPEHEYEHHMFPINRVSDWHHWVFGWRDYWRDHGDDLHNIEQPFVKGVLERIVSYEMPIIRLSEKNSREAICLVFEKVNVGGKKLDAFELLTAIFAADRFDLRHDWLGSAKTGEVGRRERIQDPVKRQRVFDELKSTDFLQACTILHTMDRHAAAKAEAPNRKDRDLPQVSCKRDTMLRLPVDAYKRYADDIEEGFRRAGRFMNQQKIMWQWDVPYPPQMVALAATFALLGKKAHSATATDKLERWFWCGVLGELYGSATETKLARDVPQLVRWIEGDQEEPWTVQNAYFQVDRLDYLKVRNSAAYKGMHALLMRHGCRDFISGDQADFMTMQRDEIDIHHIFPRKWCADNAVDESQTVVDAIVNKSPLSRLSNQIIGGSAPSKYLAKIEAEYEISPKQMDDILRSHLIEPEHLRNDDFPSFYTARKAALADLVRQTMGGEHVVGEEMEEEPHYPTPDSIEEDLLEVSS